MTIDFENLAHCLKDSSSTGRDVIFIPNPGNAGDAVINYATFQLLQKTNHNFQIGTIDEVYPGKIILYGGGGNLVGHYQTAKMFLQRNHSICHQLIILPHTIRAYPDLLYSLGSNCTIFCREPFSLQYVRNNVSRAQAELSHDVALFLDLTNMKQDYGDLPTYLRLSGQRLADWKSFAKYLFRMSYSTISIIGRQRTMFAFRRDIERTQKARPIRNIDLSIAIPYRSTSFKDTLFTCSSFVSYIDLFERVATNRLHVGIVGALLGKRVELSANSYSKNRHVFDHSLKHNFETVTWVD